MVLAAIISTVLLLLIFSEIYFIGKYISVKQGMFTSNRFAAFSVGFISYFAITFAVLFVFIFFQSSIIYYIVFFVIKDTIQIMFLLSRRDIFNTFKLNIKEPLMGLIAVIGLTCLFNFVAPLLQPIRDNRDFMSFQSWYKFEELISKVTSINLAFIYKWFASLLVTGFGYASVMAFTTHFAKRNYWWSYFFGMIVTGLIIFGFSFGKSIESQVGAFIVLFAILCGVNIIVFSRRRYASVYGVTTIAAWSFNQNLVLVLLLIAFVILVIYTILQKPKVSMFWVQLMAPIGLVSTFWINDFSRPLGLTISIGGVLLYMFMVSVGQTKTLEKLDHFFLRLRFVTPIAILLGIIAAGVYIGVTSKEALSSIVIKDMTYLFHTYDSKIANYVQIALYSSLIAMIITYLAYIFFYKKKILKPHLVGIICSLIILFALNPAFWLIINGSVLQEQFKYISTAILPPLIIIAFVRIHTIQQNKNITYV